MSKGASQNDADDLRMHLKAAFELQLRLRKAGYFVHGYTGTKKNPIWYGGGLPAHARIFRKMEEEI